MVENPSQDLGANAGLREVVGSGSGARRAELVGDGRLGVDAVDDVSVERLRLIAQQLLVLLDVLRDEGAPRQSAFAKGTVMRNQIRSPLAREFTPVTNSRGRGVALEGGLPRDPQHGADRRPRRTLDAGVRDRSVDPGLGGRTVGNRGQNIPQHVAVVGGDRVRPLATVRILDLVEQFFVGSHPHHLLSQELRSGPHGVEDPVELRAVPDLKQLAGARGSDEDQVAVHDVNRIAFSLA